MLQRPRVTRIEAVEWETDRHATIRFHDEALAQSPPGTFAMVWVPGVDEVPMGTGYTDGAGRVTLTVEAKGDCTRALVEMDKGERIGVRGPYGRGFRMPAKGRVCFIGGGTGIAPMVRGAHAAMAGCDVTVISGARSQDLLLLDGHLRDLGVRYLPCTDDGSHGFSGFTTQCLEELLAAQRFDYVAACGPEAMMVRARDICVEAGITMEASLERYMKCAIGICDACTVGEGDRLCVEGPVMDAGRLATVHEFGVGHRDAAGILHPW